MNEHVARQVESFDRTHAPKPREDARHVNLQREYPAARLREAGPKAVWLRLRDDAALRDRAVRLERVPRLLVRGVLLRAALERVQRDLVVVHVVDGLDDVDLARVGPHLLDAVRPERGPDRAAERDVQGVDDDQRARAVAVQRS